ncbi:MAG: hypothetical protein IJV64_09915 [Oscillospiraceae bacterium]|nr:hypothetical protein [Oscillospiraceae bacterium]
MKKLTICATLLEEMLGTAAADKKIHENYIASKAEDAEKIEEEIASLGVDGVVEKSMTVFPKDKDGCPILWDYQVRGYLKESIGFLKKTGEAKACAGVRAHKKTVDGNIFVQPRKIRLEMPVEGGKLGDCQRPLRAETAQGPRVALANSETVPAGTQFTFDVICFNDGDAKAVVEAMDYGLFHGMGQWRNSGKGVFDYEVLDEVTLSMAEAREMQLKALKG